MGFYDSLYSKAVSDLHPSPIREMFHLIRKPGMISFAGGMPDPAIFPVEEFFQATEILENQGRDVLQYGTTEGYPPLMEFLLDWTAPRMGRRGTQEEILITAGSSQVSDLLCWSLVDPGDLVILEEPSFLGIFLNMHNHGAQFLTVPCDADGMMVDLLPEKIEAARRSGRKVKLCYTIANFHNPLGCTLSTERRRKLVEYARRYGFAILEDDPYGYLRFDGEHLPTLYSMDGGEGSVIYSGSFSKILAPGTRVGWCVGPKEIIRKMAVFKQGVDVCTSLVAQALVYEYCRLGHLEGFLPNIVNHYRSKRDDMEGALRRHLPPEEVSWVKPQGGFFHWIAMKNVQAQPLFERAVEKKVAFVPGAAFYPNRDGGAKEMRLCFTFASPEDTEEGTKRLGESVRELMGE
jgi:2-aminoadipate transaminase